MRFHVTNRHNGQRYKADGDHWPGQGWYIRVYDFDQNAWGRARSGTGPGPVMTQGWQKDIERQGYEVPVLAPPVDIRKQEMNRLAQSFGHSPCPICKGAGNIGGTPCPSCHGRGTAPAPTPAAQDAPPPTTEGKIDWGKRLAALRKRRGESKATVLIATLLEDCVPGGSAKGERHDTSGLDKKELAMGRKVEREHTKGAPHAKRAAEEIAIDHLSEPGHKKYYSRLMKSGLADELK